MSRILVTGGYGLVGSEFTNNILRISSKDCDLTSKNQTDKLIDFYTNKNIHGDNVVDKIVHCAAKVGGLGSNMSYKADYFYQNIMMNTNIIEAARANDIKKMVCFLSTCIFPDKVDYPLTEAKIHLGPPHFSNDAYAYAKRMTDVQIRAYKEQYGLNYTSVIPTNIYGPNDNYSLTDGHVIPMLIHKMYLAQRDNTDFVVWGSGKPLREFIYSKDVAKLTEWILDNYNESEPIILSTSEEISIADIVYLIAKEFDFKGRIVFDTNKPDGQFRKPTDNSKLKGYLPNFAFTPIEEGLKETVQHFIKNYENARK